MTLSRETAVKIAQEREKFLEADRHVPPAAIAASASAAVDAEQKVEDLVRARRRYQDALDEGERELGL